MLPITPCLRDRLSGPFQFALPPGLSDLEATTDSNSTKKSPVTENPKVEGCLRHCNSDLSAERPPWVSPQVAIQWMHRMYKARRLGQLGLIKPYVGANTDKPQTTCWVKDLVHPQCSLKIQKGGTRIKSSKLLRGPGGMICLPSSGQNWYPPPCRAQI